MAIHRPLSPIPAWITAPVWLIDTIPLGPDGELKFLSKD